MNIESKDILAINYYKKGKAYTGSFQGMRYRIVKIDKTEEMPAMFLVDIWPEPLNYESTDKEKIVSKNFPYDKEGYNNVLEYLNEAWEKKAYLI